MMLQLTEPTLLLIFTGIISLRKRFKGDIAVLILIWFILPVAGIWICCINLYDNFRQVFFILPPLFLLAGAGLDWIFGSIRCSLTRFVILLLIMLPGLYANITLYPYQYIYYNQLTGGIRGAYRVFELDYWHIAFKEAQSYINENALPNANIFAGNSKPNAQTFARPDLVFNAFGGRMKIMEKYDYILVSTTENGDERFAEYPTVFTVKRDGVPLIHVKKTR